MSWESGRVAGSAASVWRIRLGLRRCQGKVARLDAWQAQGSRVGWIRQAELASLRVPESRLNAVHRFLCGASQSRVHQETAAHLEKRFDGSNGPGMAEGLGLETAAEGIEDLGQLDALRAIGCRWGQGHLWSRPVPGDAVPSLLSGATSLVRGRRGRPPRRTDGGDIPSDDSVFATTVQTLSS